jgi:hypothetical protein
MSVHPYLQDDDLRSLEIDLLDVARREPGSTWTRIEKLLSIDGLEAVSGRAYVLMTDLVGRQHVAADLVEGVDGTAWVVYRATDDGVERLSELVPSGELPAVEPLGASA